MTPTLPVIDMDASVEFYEAAGFEVEVYEGGGFAFVSYEDRSVFDLGLESAASGAGAYLVVPDPDEWHARLEGRGIPVGELVDQDHGMREFTLTDPSGNRPVRFGGRSRPGPRSRSRRRRSGGPRGEHDDGDTDKADAGADEVVAVGSEPVYRHSPSE